MSDFATPDLSDAYPDARHLELQLRLFGQRERFAGPVSTIACHADNSKVAEAVAEPGAGRVLLVDGRGDLRTVRRGCTLTDAARVFQHDQRGRTRRARGRHGVLARDGRRRRPPRKL